MYFEIQSVELSLRDSLRGHTISGMICIACGQTLPDSAIKCRSCKNTKLHQRLCNSDSRVAGYFAVLRKADLWPIMMQVHTFSPLELAFRISGAIEDLRHSCAALNSCPLVTELESLSNKLFSMLEKVKGMPLYPLRRHE